MENAHVGCAECRFPYAIVHEGNGMVLASVSHSDDTLVWAGLLSIQSFCLAQSRVSRQGSLRCCFHRH